VSAAAEPAGSRVFSPKVVLWMVLIGVFSFSAFLVLSAYAPDLRSGSDGGAHALSKSAVGFAGLAELLKAEGTSVVISRADPPRGANQSGVLVLTPDPSSGLKEIQKLHYSGSILIILPKWITVPSPLHQGWVQAFGTLPAEAVASTLGGTARKVVVAQRKGSASTVLYPVAPIKGAPMQLGAIDSLQTVSSPDLVPVLADEQGKAVLARYGQTSTFVLADPDLLNTHGLADRRTARAAQQMLDNVRSDAKGPVIFDVTLNGFRRARSLLKLGFEPPLLGATLCLAFAAALMGLHAAFRFGPPAVAARAVALGKRALADNSAALVRLARREPRMATGYAALCQERAARAVGAPRNLGEAASAELLDRLGAGRGAGTTFSALKAEAEGVKTNADLMTAARRLYQWTWEVTRARR
jgi:hypothetical protein